MVRIDIIENRRLGRKETLRAINKEQFLNTYSAIPTTTARYRLILLSLYRAVVLISGTFICHRKITMIVADHPNSVFALNQDFYLTNFSFAIHLYRWLSTVPGLTDPRAVAGSSS